MEADYLTCEPMDIDLSTQSVKDMDISFNDADDDIKPLTRPSSKLSVSPLPKHLHPRTRASPIKQRVVRKGHINIKKPARNFKSTLLTFISFVIIVFISIITYHMCSVKCCNQMNLNSLSEILSNKLYGQSAAVSLFIKTLESNARSKIVFLSGGTGVGKTFTSSLLLDSVGSYSNVYHYTMPTFENSFSSDLMLGLTLCKMSLIIVDDLTTNNMKIKLQIKNVIEKSQDLGKDITVILIFNCNEDYKNFGKKCDKSFNSKLLDYFADIRAHKTVIEYQPLTEEHLKECINQELGNRKLDEVEYHNVLKNFNVTVDGCKGVHSKMKYLYNV